MNETYNLLTLKIGSLDAGCSLEVTRKGLDSRGLCGMPVGRVIDYDNAIVRGDRQDGWWDPECSCSIVVKAGTENDDRFKAMLIRSARERIDKRAAELGDIKRRMEAWLGSYDRMASQLPGLNEINVPGSDEAVYGKADAPVKPVRARRYALTVASGTLVYGWATSSIDVAEALIGKVMGEIPLDACVAWEAAYVWVADGDLVDDYVSALADEARRTITATDLPGDVENRLLGMVNSWEEDFDEADDDDDEDEEDDDFVECTRYAFAAWEENGDLVVELQDQGYEETVSNEVGEAVQEGDVDLHTDSDNAATLASVCIPEGDELDDDVLERLIESATEALRDAGCEDDFGHNPIDLVVDAANAFSAARDRDRQPRVVEVSLPPKRTVDVGLPPKRTVDVALPAPPPPAPAPRPSPYLSW